MSVDSYNIHVLESLDNQHTLHWYHHIGDLLNIFKAFIGSSYLSVPFAFMQSGLVFGICGVFLVASVTCHCCLMLVTCKEQAVVELLEDLKLRRPSLTQQQLSNEERRLNRTLTYSDLGRIALGTWSSHLIAILVAATQLLCCVMYFIFIGNTALAMFPLSEPSNNTVDAYEAVPMLAMVQLQHHLGEQCAAEASVNYVTNIEYTTTTRPVIRINFTTIPPHLSTLQGNLTTSGIGISTEAPHILDPTHPDLRLLILMPLIFFIITSMIRHLRTLSPFTTIAGCALLMGATAVITFLCKGFTIDNDIALYKLKTLPIFIGQLIAAYEGIGCVIPIHSSMEGNRHLFKPFLVGVVYFVFIILGSFGVMGYLRYGEDVSQIIVLNMASEGKLINIVDGTLIVSVLFTYPLQFFPFMEIMEGYIFEPGRIFGPPEVSMSCNELPINISPDGDRFDFTSSDDSHNLLEDSTRSVVSTTSENIMHVPESVASWKRNMFRLLLTLLTCGLAILLRDVYVYISSFTGAIGASSLAFILPCCIHLRLFQNQLSLCTKIKDWTIIIVSIAASLTVIVTIITMIVNKSIKL